MKSIIYIGVVVLFLSIFLSFQKDSVTKAYAGWEYVMCYDDSDDPHSDKPKTNCSVEDVPSKYDGDAIRYCKDQGYDWGKPGNSKAFLHSIRKDDCQ